VLGGLYGGIVTLTESAALSAVVAIVLSLFVYRGIRPIDVVPAMAAAVRNAAVIMIIIAVALAFGHWVTETGLTTRAVALIKTWNVQGWQFLLVINALLLILGMFLEVYSVMLLIVPVVVPMLAPLHIDPIHFGVVLTINMEIALLTPPVGLNLFVIANISKTPLAEVVRGTMPFVVLMLGLLALITYVPIFSLWLPGLALAK
jgi:C4-dicarboxylate transporter, DctM subunit